MIFSLYGHQVFNHRVPLAWTAEWLVRIDLIWEGEFFIETIQFAVTESHLK